jgi:hypothetical protein
MISEGKNFLFIHVPKAAGNSVAERLLPHCSEAPPEVDSFKNEAVILVDNRFGLKRHASVGKWVRALGVRPFLNTFKFAVLRNPWDRLVSHYIFKQRAKHKTGGTLEEVEYGTFDHGKFLRWLREFAVTFDELCYLREDQIDPKRRHEIQPGYHIDYFLRFENLGEDWETLCHLLDIPHEPVQHRNKGSHADYRKYYRPDTYREVARLCAREIGHFGYRF